MRHDVEQSECLICAGSGSSGQATDCRLVSPLPPLCGPHAPAAGAHDGASAPSLLTSRVWISEGMSHDMDPSSKSSLQSLWRWAEQRPRR